MPLANINPSLVNVDDSHLSLFTDRHIPNGPHTLPAPGNNIQSAAGIYQNGGRKINRKKINKISNKYKMRGSRKQIRRIKSRLLRRSRRTRSNRGTRTRRRRSNKRMRGGQSQYMSNVAANASYSTGGILSASDSARANPVPFASNDVNSFDAYNHYR